MVLIFYGFSFLGNGLNVYAEDIDFNAITKLLSTDGKVSKWVGEKPFIHILGDKNSYVVDNMVDIMSPYVEIFDSNYTLYDTNNNYNSSANIVILFFDNYENFSRNQEKYFGGYNKVLGATYRKNAERVYAPCHISTFRKNRYSVYAGFIAVDNSRGNTYAYNCVLDNLNYLFGVIRPEDSIWQITPKTVIDWENIPKSYLSKNELDALSYISKPEILPGALIGK